MGEKMSLLGTPDQIAECEAEWVTSGPLPPWLPSNPDYQKSVREAAEKAKDLNLNWFGK